MKRYAFLYRLGQSPLFWLSAILLVGAGLRLCELGTDSFWVDEAGVAYAARMPTLAGVLDVVRSHVMAMPLDYLIVWLVAHWSVDEAVLRLPAVLWGVLSLALSYPLFRRMVSPAPALLGVLILALSPLHIQYSQELRFYASLVFFYLASTLYLFDALKQPTRQRWLIFLIVHVIGIYFHPYVFFALCNGFVWLALRPQKGALASRLRINYLVTATASLLTFFIGYRLFSAGNFFQIPLMAFEPSPLTAILTGLGWFPFAVMAPGLSWVWGFLCAVLEVIGARTALRQNWRSPLAGLFYSLLLQIGLVIGSDLLGHYLFAPRQLIMLLPGLCLFAGIGAWEVIGVLTRKVQQMTGVQNPSPIYGPMITFSVVLLILVSLPAITLYEKDDKGNSRAVIEQILQEWQPGDSVLITPGMDGFVYKYYLDYVYEQPTVSERLWTSSFEDVSKTKDWTGQVFVIAPSQLPADQEAEMQSLGLVQRYQTNPLSRYGKTLWTRSQK